MSTIKENIAKLLESPDINDKLIGLELSFENLNISEFAAILRNLNRTGEKFSIKDIDYIYYTSNWKTIIFIQLKTQNIFWWLGAAKPEKTLIFKTDAWENKRILIKFKE